MAIYIAYNNRRIDYNTEKFIVAAFQISNNPDTYRFILVTEEVQADFTLTSGRILQGYDELVEGSFIAQELKTMYEATNMFERSDGFFVATIVLTLNELIALEKLSQ